MLIDIKAAVRTPAEEPRPVRTGRTKQEPAVMTGFPMRKLRKTGVVDEEGNVVIILRLPSVICANKRPGWDQ